MRRWVFTLFLAAAALAAPVSAQKQGQLFLSLTTADGTPVDGLTAGEVTVTEDGAACKTLNVEAIAWPTKVQVLVDNGKSNTTPINPLRDGLKELFALIPEGVEMSMYVTAGTPRAVVKPTTDRKKLIDGIGLIAPDNGAGMFFDALLEASERVDKDKTPNFPVIVMVGSDLGSLRVIERDYLKLQTNVFNHGITTHVLLNVGGPGTGASGGVQVEVGTNIAKLSGGRFENFNGTTRLATLLPEIGKQIAQSVALQSHQYRVTYERPVKPNERAAIGVDVRRNGVPRLSLRGNQ